MRSARAAFPAELRSVPEARRFLRATLEGWSADGLEWAASQALTELVTNAVLHARTDFEVALTLDDDVLRMGVTDASAKQPLARRWSDQSTTGRGLRLVDSLAQAWGVQPDGRGGKTVWCTFPAASSGDGEQGAEDMGAHLLAMLDGDADPDAAGWARAG